MTQPKTQLWVTEGTTVTNNGRDYVVIAIADINLAIAKDVLTGQSVLLKIGDMSLPNVVEASSSLSPSDIDLRAVSDEEWAAAESRRQLIQPLLSNRYGHAAAEKVAEEADVSRATVYRWALDFRNTGLLSSLLDRKTLRGGKGVGRLRPEVEAIIKSVQESFYDTEQKPSKEEAFTEIRRLCVNAGLPPQPKTLCEGVWPTQRAEHAPKVERAMQPPMIVMIQSRA
ncbi:MULTISPECIES: helix-turn-helix domain-containing protein [unclassified Polaromonas]|uniref:helix-turn-helix domain-containing protein n=1 Tax=unclassified Polaromonas TaxID=2638319 RepID=UPI001E41DF03|nr:MULTISPECIES: helix-turn-helix domain-containing protein [unclassified Polaromonas]